MKKINKYHNEPTCLTSYKRHTSPHDHDYKKFRENEPDCYSTLKIELAKEAGFLCCYCMQSIAINNDKIDWSKAEIEHFKPKSIYNGANGMTDLRLDYSNLLAACTSKGHCGNLKDNGEVVFPNPSSNEFIDFQNNIRYKMRYKKLESDKKIYIVQPTNSEDLENDDIVGIKKGKLNLNDQNLAKRRYAAWEGVKKKLEKSYDKISLISEQIIKYSTLHQISREHNGETKTYYVYHEFCDVILFFLEMELSKTH